MTQEQREDIDNWIKISICDGVSRQMLIDLRAALAASERERDELNMEHANKLDREDHEAEVARLRAALEETISLLHKAKNRFYDGYHEANNGVREAEAVIALTPATAASMELLSNEVQIAQLKAKVVQLEIEIRKGLAVQ